MRQVPDRNGSDMNQASISATKDKAEVTPAEGAAARAFEKVKLRPQSDGDLHQLPSSAIINCFC